MTESTAPLDEEWTFDGLLFLGGGLVVALVFGPAAIAFIAEPWLGVYTGATCWFMAMGYESGLIPQFKWEVQRRLWPTSVVDEQSAMEDN
ncbi:MULTISPECIES: hypothetical protein [Halobacteriales]|uniref:Uncharacterized protein n=2 Tax=Halobacteriales TaxID=2235 RepID=A0A1I0QZ12_9EURY|nr:hypothetical protein [Natrinema salifodinae]SEW33127.1 hypothetical protein SAMN05216285_4209 [Natrinema salifodinae]